MRSKRILLDTGVWISYFGDRSANQSCRIQLARQIINYCLEQKFELFYCPYVEFELNNRVTENRIVIEERKENVAKMKKIAKCLPGYIGNDAWGQINAITWDQWCGNPWNNEEEINMANQLEAELPDTSTKKPNRIDRNIFLTAKQERICVFLHENPKDFGKLSSDEHNDIMLIDLTKLSSLDQFIKLIAPD